MRKYILMIMSIGFMFAILAVGTQPSYVYAAVTEYGLCVGGTQVTSENAENIPKSKGAETTGKASYNAETNTLTLEDYKCTGIRTGPEEYGRYNTYGVIEYKGTDQLTIELVGENELKAVDLEYNNTVYPQLRAAIFSEDGSFNITGDGELVAYGPDEMYRRDADGILTWRGNIIIDGPTIYAQAGRSKTSGVGIDAGYVTIKSGSVTAKGSPEEHSMSIGIRASNEIRIEKGVTLVEASGLRNAVSDKTVNLIPGKYWTDPEGTEGEGIIDVNEEGGNLLWIGKKIVFKEVYYPLYVGGRSISTRNEDDVFGDGTVRFVPANGDIPATLTLNNFRYSTFTNSFLGVHDGVIAYRGEDTLILEIKGRNVLKGNGVSHGIVFNGTLIIRGDGSLSVAGYNNNNQIIYNTKDAHGIYGDSKTADLLIESGTIEASGGRSVDATKKYNGIKVRSVTVNGGTLTATGRTYGIDGDVTVGKDMSGVEITGTSGAISQDHILKNDASGKGWSDTGGTEGEERIEINKEGSSYSYKKILFNKPAIIVDMPVASESVYDGTSQPLLSDTGTASGGTLCYALGDKNGPTEQFTGSIPKAKDAGTYYVWCQVAADADHSDLEPICVTVDIKKKPMTITVNGSGETRVYSGQEQVFEGTVTAAGSDSEFNASKFSYTGPVTVKGTYADVYTTALAKDGCFYNDKNYEITWSIGDPVKLTIDQASITPTVSIQGWDYGSAANKPVVTGNLGGGAESYWYKEKDAPDSAYTKDVPVDAGTYTVKAEIAETKNYKAGSATLDFTISPIDLQVTSSGFSGAYDRGEHSIIVNAPAGASVLYAQPGGSFTEENPAFKDAGTYEVDFKVTLKNYNEYEGSATVEITKAPITIAADDKSSFYGKDLEELTYTLNGAYVEGDDLGIVLSTDADLTTPGTYPITVSWNENPNYEATLVNGEYQVTEKVDPIIPPDDTPVDPDVPVVNTAKISTKGNFTKKQMQIRFPGHEAVTNYRIQYRMAGKKAWKSGWSAGTNTYIIKGLKRSSLCEFRIAGYVKQADGTWIRGNWSKVSYRYMSAVPLKTIKADKKKIMVTWTKDRKASGYQIQCSLKKNMAGARTITINGASKTKCTIKGLKSGKRYYVKIRPVKAKPGKKYLGILTKAKTAKVK